MKKNRSFLATWSDDESEDYQRDEQQGSQTIAIVAMTLGLESDTKH